MVEPEGAKIIVVRYTYEMINLCFLKIFLFLSILDNFIWFLYIICMDKILDKCF